MLIIIYETYLQVVKLLDNKVTEITSILFQKITILILCIITIIDNIEPQYNIYINKISGKIDIFQRKLRQLYLLETKINIYKSITDSSPDCIFLGKEFCKIPCMTQKSIRLD